MDPAVRHCRPSVEPNATDLVMDVDMVDEVPRARPTGVDRRGVTVRPPADLTGNNRGVPAQGDAPVVLAGAADPGVGDLQTVVPILHGTANQQLVQHNVVLQNGYG